MISNTISNEDILRHVDHTLLKATASWAEIETLCQEAVKYHTASVCVPASYLARIHKAFPGLLLCTVIGFPLGYDTTATKKTAVETALLDGADEIDMVVNLGDVKNGEFDKVTAEIATLKKACGSKILKVIVETCYLTEAEKEQLCACVTEGGADYIKTSTGFGTGGATLPDVLLFKKHIGPGVKIKAAGGMKTREDFVAFLEAGCDRLGTSSAVKVLEGQEAGGY